MKTLITRSLVLLGSLALAACATQSPVAVSDGTNTSSVPSMSSTTDNPYGATPYTPNDATSSTPASSSSTIATNSAAYAPQYPPVDVQATYHQVVSGDTVYNIAKRYAISQDDLRSWNNLNDNAIQIGQTLRVKPLSASSTTTTTSQTAANPTIATKTVAPLTGSGTHQVVAGDTVYNIAKRYNITQDQLRQANQLLDNNIKIGQILRVGDGGQTVATPIPKAATANTNSFSSVTTPAPTSTTPVITSTKTTTTIAKTTTSPASKTTKHDGITWQSPLSGGTVDTAFVSGKNNNIKLAAKTGSDIVAAADGQVIFVGKTPRGYSGNLVIIQHEAGYVTAYSNNDDVVVKETQKVKRGQKLGTLDSDGTMVFEMRYGDTKKPVDPSKIIDF